MSSSLHLWIGDNMTEMWSNRNMTLLLQTCCLKPRNWFSGDWNWNSNLSLSTILDCRKHYCFSALKSQWLNCHKRYHVHIHERVQTSLTVKFSRNVSLELSIQSVWFSLCLLGQHKVQLAKKNRKTFRCKDCIQTQKLKKSSAATKCCSQFHGRESKTNRHRRL
jgi:hypothetical protein